MRMWWIAGVATIAWVSPPSAQGQSVRVDGPAFKDAFGRTLMLRGVNLAGSSKIPMTPNDDPRAVSFVGRPFPLAQADEHFRRLKNWGLTTERLIVPWEAIEHGGPGQYDQAYLDYLHALVGKARNHGISVYIDAHQDSWSRAFSGDGAPYWTSQAIGLVADPVSEAGSSRTFANGEVGYWPPTHAMHGAWTMYTLFWAGNDFAPGIEVDGMPVQDYLQSHYIAAVVKVAERLRDLDNVIGFDTWNEPLPGYIGTPDLSAPLALMEVLGKSAGPGDPAPGAWDFFQASSGFKPDGSSVVKPGHLWAAGAQDIWRRLGVWDVRGGKPVLLRPDYFAKAGGKPADFDAYLKSFQQRYVAAIHKVAPKLLVMQELSILGGPSRADGMALGAPNIVSEPHFYDSMVLLSGRYTPEMTSDFEGNTYRGRDQVLGYYVKALEDLKADGMKLGGVPTLLGETGITFKVNGKEAYRTGDYSAQESLARNLFDALDKTMLSYSIWNYSPDNDHAHGDWWQGEDLSIFSPGDRKNPADLNSGGRALHQIVRPYPMATAGTPLALHFDVPTRTFEYRYRVDPAVKADTEIFVPTLQYPNGFTVSVQGASYVAEPSQSRIRIRNGRRNVTVQVRPIK